MDHNQKVWQRMVLEDFLNSWFTRHIDKIRNDKQVLEMPFCGPDSSLAVEQHVEFAMEYFASFGTALVPTMGVHKAVLHVLAKRYAIYPKARQNNDWVKEQAPVIRILVTHALKLCKRSESSRSKRIGFFKTFMHKMMVDQGAVPEASIEAALQNLAVLGNGSSSEEFSDASIGSSPPAGLHVGNSNERVANPVVNPDEMATVPIDVNALGDIEQEASGDGHRRQATKDKKPIEEIPPALSKEDMDRLGMEETTESDAYGAQLARKHAAKIEGAQKLVEKASKDPKVIKQLKADTGRGRGKGKGKGRGRGKKQTEPETPPEEPVPPASEQPDHPEEVADQQPDDAVDGNDPLEILWKKKEKELRIAAIPIPSDAKTKKSYALKPPAGNSTSSTIGILWTLDQIYVTRVTNPQDGVNTNKKGGASLSIRRKGGWGHAFNLAKTLAGW